MVNSAVLVTLRFQMEFRRSLDGKVILQPKFQAMLLQTFKHVHDPGPWEARAFH